MLLITLLSLISLPDADPGGLQLPYMDKAAHFIFHAVGAFLGSLWLRDRKQGGRNRNHVLWRILILMLVYGIIIEVLQDRLTTWRSAEMADVLADLLGALAGVGGIQMLYRADWQLKWKF